MMEPIAKIIGIMFMSRTYAHMAHLKTSSYAKHKALETFYTNIVDKIDMIAEAAQGKMGKLDIPFIPIKGEVEDPISSLEMQLTMIENASKRVSESYLIAVLDEIHGCYYRTLYRLKELD